MSYNTKIKTNKNKKNRLNQTRKTHIINVHGDVISNDKEGWKVIHIYGKPYERGFAHGYLLFDELRNTIKLFEFMIKEYIKVSLRKYLRVSNRLIKPVLKNNFPEFYEEIQGISAGAKRKGLHISVDLLIGWNSYMSLYSYFKEGAPLKCSAFIATGSATKNGDIIMAHNTHTNLPEGFKHNIILYITPSTGHPFVMQTSPGQIASVTDWFLCSTGIIGCETTIANINYKPKFGYPFYCRIRQAMQYGESLDDYDKIMSEKNSGDYACSWQFGNIKTNEIMLLELGLNIKSVKRTKNGVFYGMNSAMDDELRTKETTDIDHTNITTSLGARNKRLDELLNHKYKGKIDMSNAKKVLADHYDVYLRRDEMTSRCICKHVECDPTRTTRAPNYPFGCTDGKVVNSEMAKNLSFWGRFGSACGRVFNVKKYTKDNPEHLHFKPHLKDIPKNDWIIITN